MRHFRNDLLQCARPETRPELPKKIRLRARFFGKQQVSEYLWNYYERESESRIPFYLPYIYRKEFFDYARRTAQIPKSKVRMVLIDGGDARIDFFLYEFLQELNYLTIITDRTEYFLGLQERAFQELGLLIDLQKPWEEKSPEGNVVWDFTKTLQKPDCYPPGSIAWMPHKKLWKLQEQIRSCENVTAVYMKEVRIGQRTISPSLAECLLVTKNFPFRESRCRELEQWCRRQNWKIELDKVKNLDN